MNTQMEIICVGNELLIGKTLNTNAHWMAKRATSLGIMVRQITVVGDETNEIARATREALRRKPAFIITSGGLGPTFDDKTLQGVAKALSRKMRVNRDALRMVKEKYEAYARAGRIEKVEMTPARVKMATLPEKAEPLPNPVGTAPGVKMIFGDTIIVALPGVPSEMEAIFEGSVVPLLRERAGGAIFFEASLHADGIMESALAPLVDEVMRDNQHVYIKSHPKGAEKKPHLEIHFSTTTRDLTEAKEFVGKAMAELSELIRENGGKVTLED